MRAYILSSYGYVPEEQENWLYEMINEAGEVVASLEFHYSNGGIYASQDDQEPFFLGYITSSNFWLEGNFFAPCLEEQQYSIRASHVDAVAPDIFFEPTAFRPGTPAFAGIAPIKPYLPLNQVPSKFGGGEAEVATITVTVEDSIGCEKPMEDVTVTFDNTIVPESGGHKHFSSYTKKGTGEYLSGTPSEGVVIADPEYGITITGTTGDDGKFSADYKAGIFGVKERITAVTALGEYTSLAETELLIAVPGLIPLDTSGSTYRIVGSFKTSCDKTHNDSATERRSHYVRPYFRTKIGELNRDFHDATGEHLCLNDASLPYGGYFDDGEGGECHISHRAGTDIDVNRTCEGMDMDLTFTIVDEQGQSTKPIPKSEYLDLIASRLRLFKAKEDPLHYRLIDETEWIAGNEHSPE